MVNIKNINKNILCFIKSLILPILFVVYFVSFHYANNASIIRSSSAAKILALLIFVSFVISLGFSLIMRGAIFKTALAATIFMIFFALYGIIYDYLLDLDLLQVKHYSMIPLYLLTSIYFSLSIKKLNGSLPKNITYISSTILILFIFINLLTIIPTEIRKFQLSEIDQKIIEPISENLPENKEVPDIYYIVLDEAASFNVIRDYFKYNEILYFENHLKEMGFFVAENSHSRKPNTLYQMSSIFNMGIFPYLDDTLTYFQAITENQVFRYLQEKGYSIAVLEELSGPLGFAEMPNWQNVDFILDPDGYEDLRIETLHDDFLQMVANQTLLKPFFSHADLTNPAYAKHKTVIDYSFVVMENIDHIQSPKFLYIHLMLPHTPFMFDRHGNLNYPRHYVDWNYYLEQYIFSMNLAEYLIDSIINSSKGSNPPVIILQSDHGARVNRELPHDEFRSLDNYPDDYENHIINAILLPYCKDIKFSNDMDPINTFPIIFNCLFDENFPLDKEIEISNN